MAQVGKERALEGSALSCREEPRSSKDGSSAAEVGPTWVKVKLAPNNRAAAPIVVFEFWMVPLLVGFRVRVWTWYFERRVEEETCLVGL